MPTKKPASHKAGKPATKKPARHAGGAVKPAKKASSKKAIAKPARAASGKPAKSAPKKGALKPAAKKPVELRGAQKPINEDMSNDVIVSGCDLYVGNGFGAAKARLPNERHHFILP